SSDCATALASGWEKVRRAPPMAAQRESLRSRDAISRFLGLVEGRTRLSIPIHWEESLNSAKWSGRDAIQFPDPKALTEGRQTNASSTRPSLRRVAGQWVAKQGTMT